MPSHTPSESPSAIPSALPTAEAREATASPITAGREDTASPTAEAREATASPTVAGREDTASPTAEVREETRSPSASPTVHISSSPSRTTTGSPTLVTSSSTTAMVEVTISFQAEVAFKNLDASYLEENESAREGIKEALASTMAGVDAENIRIISIRNEMERLRLKRRLQGSRGGEEDEVLIEFEINYIFEVAASEEREQEDEECSELFSELTAELETGVETGALTEELSAIAAENGISELEHVEVDEEKFTKPVSYEMNLEENDSSDAIGVLQDMKTYVMGGGALLLSIAVCCVYFFCIDSSRQKRQILRQNSKKQHLPDGMFDGIELQDIYEEKSDLFGSENEHTGKRARAKKYMNQFHRSDSHPAPKEPERLTEEQLKTMAPPPMPTSFITSYKYSGEEEEEEEEEEMPVIKTELSREDSDNPMIKGAAV